MTPETWTVGDPALCVESGWERVLPTDRDPRRGSIHVVRRVVHRDGRVGLAFAEYRYAYLAACFRRIAPLTEEEKREAMFEDDWHEIGAGMRAIAHDAQRRKT